MRTDSLKFFGALLAGVSLLTGCSGGGGGDEAKTPATVDTTPAPFTFADQANVDPGTVVTSAPVTITGIDMPAAVSVTGGTWSVGCTATYVATSGTVANNETVCVRHTSAATAATATHTTLTVGGVSDIFTSTTATATPLALALPFVTGASAVRLLDPSTATGGSNPATAGTGLEPPTAGAACVDCFGQALTFYAASVSGSSVSNLHAARLAYARRASGNDSGAAVFKLDLEHGTTSTPVQISSRTDACGIVRTQTTDLGAVDNTAVVLERAGPDLSCSATADNVATVIRLSSGASDGGTTLPLRLEARNPLHARTSASGAVIGYVSFESGVGDSLLLVRRDAALANPVTLLTLEQTTGASLERSDFSRLFVTATPVLSAMQLFRIESDGSLSPSLHEFSGFNAGNPIQDGVRDATHLYFTDENQVLRIALDASSGATLLTAMPCASSDTCLRVEHRVLDVGGGRLVFEAQDSAISGAGGVFSIATTATGIPATVLANNGDGLGGYAVLAAVAASRAYINVAHHGGTPTAVDALRIGTSGSGAVTTAAAYWAGSTLATGFDLASSYAAPAQHLFLARRATEDDGSGTDSLYVVDPASGATGALLGAVTNASVFLAIRIDGVGTRALARAQRDRFGNLDHDVYRLQASTAGTLEPVAETEGASDIPLDSLQRQTGNLCLLCL
ncbi:MAG TPA: hypothetical protein VM240_02565 [Verrucomicrobiae bacterium]|nr:hypothetical protein [Verrucomicrobiae bacterium]